MTISDQPKSVEYIATGGVTDFTAPWRVTAADQIAVLLDGVPQLFGAHYTVPDAGAAATTVRFNTAPTGSVFVYLDAPMTQATVFSPGPIRTTPLQQSFDEAAVRDRSLEYRLDHTLRVPLTEDGGAALTLPGATTRSGKVLGFDIDGNPVVVDSGAVVTTVAQRLATVLVAGQQTYTLPTEVTATEELEVYIQGVRQLATTDYTVSGASLTIVGTIGVDGFWAPGLTLLAEVRTFSIETVPDSAITDAKVAANADIAISKLADIGAQTVLASEAGGPPTEVTLNPLTLTISGGVMSAAVGGLGTIGAQSVLGSEDGGTPVEITLDGASLEINAGVLSATAATLPTIGAQTVLGSEAGGTAGEIDLDAGTLTINSGVLSAIIPGQVGLDPNADVDWTGTYVVPMLFGIETGTGAFIGAFTAYGNILTEYGLDQVSRTAGSYDNNFSDVHIFRATKAWNAPEIDLGAFVKIRGWATGWLARTDESLLVGGGNNTWNLFGDGGALSRGGPWLISGGGLLVDGVVEDFVTSADAACPPNHTSMTAWVRRTDGRVVTLGYAGVGGRAIGSTSAQAAATVAQRTGPTDLTNIEALWAGGGNDGFCLALATDGTWWGVGAGLPIGIDGVNKTLFTQVTTLPAPAGKGGVAKVAFTGAGLSATTAVLYGDGALYVAGYGGYGQAINGAANRTTFASVNDGGDVVLDVWPTITGGPYGGWIIKTAAALKFAGYNGNGMGPTTGTANVTTWTVMHDAYLYPRSEVPNHLEPVFGGVVVTESGSTAAATAAWHMFNYWGLTTTSFEPRADGWQVAATTNCWAQVEFDPNGVGDAAHKRTIVAYGMRHSAGFDSSLTRPPRDWRLQAWTGSAWTTLDSRSGVTWETNEFKRFTFTNTTAYARYRLLVDANNGDATFTALAGMWLWESTAVDTVDALYVTGNQAGTTDRGALLKMASGRWWSIGSAANGISGVPGGFSQANTGAWPLEVVFKDDRVPVRILGRTNNYRTFGLQSNGRAIITGDTAGTWLVLNGVVLNDNLMWTDLKVL